MDLKGLALCSRYSYPPNSLSLCGPDKKDKQMDLRYYSGSQKSDKGTLEILSQFSTLYPYLQLIAYENNIKDPFEEKVVEAYWLGNKLLYQTSIKDYVKHLSETLAFRKKMKRKELEFIFGKIEMGALPHHSFHVLNIYKRTGHLDIPHTFQTMDACLVNCGKVIKITPYNLMVETNPLTIKRGKIAFGKKVERKLIFQGDKDTMIKRLKIGDFVSYHWGYFCQKLTLRQVNNLSYYTNLSINIANY